MKLTLILLGELIPSSVGVSRPDDTLIGGVRSLFPGIRRASFSTRMLPVQDDVNESLEPALDDTVHGHLVHFLPISWTIQNAIKVGFSQVIDRIQAR